LACESQTLEPSALTIQKGTDELSSGAITGVVLETPTPKRISAERWKFFAIMMPAALSDSINPCAFAVMLLLLSTILSRHQSRRKTLLS